jgi:hypothetical protein
MGITFQSCRTSLMSTLHKLQLKIESTFRRTKTTLTQYNADHRHIPNYFEILFNMVQVIS